MSSLHPELRTTKSVKFSRQHTYHAASGKLAAPVLLLIVVGIPLGVVLSVLWPVMLVFGYLIGVMSVTDAIVGARPKKLPGNALRIFLLALGLAGMLAFCSVPVIGWVLDAVLTIASVGAMTIHAFWRARLCGAASGRLS